MNRFYNFFRFIFTLIFLLFSPLGSGQVVYGQEAPAEADSGATQTAETVEPPPEYIYNESTGRWENGTYAWDPSTSQTAPLTQKDYSYNPDTEHWDTDDWVYNTDAQEYIKPPSASVDSGTQAAETQRLPESHIEAISPSAVTSLAGPGSDGVDESDLDSDIFFDNFYDASISVSVDSTATSGSAIVAANLQAGSASSGDASATASIMNLLQSTWSGGSNPSIYTATLQGGYYGDLVIDPTNFAVGSPGTNIVDLTVTNGQSASVNNDVDLLAHSGNAIVTHNTSAGDATSGDAYAVATLLNFINSSVSSQESFIAVLNVLGDMEGDVLLSKELQSMLASSNAPTAQVSLDRSLETMITNNADYTINNNIQTTATSGAATVAHNTSAGDASTGDAQTSVTVYNFTGQEVVSDNAMLVFVNVLGSWVGFITNAPAGTSASMMTCCAASQNQSVVMNNQSDFNITNEVNVTAASGKAEVSDNTEAGSATSGSAYAAANALNVVNSSISLSGWFSILFINIFGDWHGSFGTDTAYGGYSTHSKISNVGKSGGQKSSAGSVDETGSRIIIASVASNGTFHMLGAPINQAPAIPTDSSSEDDHHAAGVLSASNGGSFQTSAIASNSGQELLSEIFWTSLTAALLLMLWRRYREQITTFWSVRTTTF